MPPMTDHDRQSNQSAGAELAPWTFDRIVTPFSAAQFAELLNRRVPLRFPAVDATLWSSLLSWDRVKELVESGAVSVSQIQVTRDGEPVPHAFYCAGRQLQPSRLFELVDRGFSLLIRHIERACATLGALTADIEATLGERVRVSLVSTTGQGGALQRHFDPGDVLAIQLEGAKRWRIYDRPVEHPIPAGPCVERAADGATELDTVLSSGDRLFVPAGYWHRCENQQGRSLHISIVLNPVCQQNLLAAVAQTLVADRECRRPGIRSVDRAARAAAIRGLKTGLQQRLDAMSIDDLTVAYLGNGDGADPE